MKWSRNTAFLNAPDIETWPTVHSSLVSEAERDSFAQRVTAIKLYQAGYTLKEIKRRTGVASSELRRLSARCLELGVDGQVVGFRALVKYNRIKPYVKHALSGPKRREQQGGQSGALNYLFQLFPDIEDTLVAAVRQDAKKFQIHEHRLNSVALHGCFIRTLKEKVKQGLYPEYAWPFNTKYLGLRSIQKYMKELVLLHFSRIVNKRGEAPAKAHLTLSNGKTPLLLVDEPFDVVEIDSHRIDAFCVVRFSTPEGTEITLVTERLWLIAAVERASSAILAWRMVYRSEVDADEVLKLMKDAISSRWRPRELTISGLKYETGSGMPSGLLPQAEGAIWSATFFDGALAHLSRKVSARARKLFGFMVNWGGVGHFERRPNVERTFGTIEKAVLQRLPSTTGSNPFNGRATDPQGAALKYGIHAEHIEDLVDVFIARHNITPTSGLSWLSPIGFLKHYLTGETPLCEVRRLAMKDQELTNIFICVEVRTVRGSLADGRRPYVQIDGVKYTSPVLADSAALLGMKITLHIDESDMRHVRAFLPDGTDFGLLTAARRWAQTKHSRQTRKAILSLITERILTISEFDDPVEVYLQHLATARKKAKSSKSTVSAKQVTQATRISKESGIPVIVKEEEPITTATDQTLRTVAARPSLLKKGPLGMSRIAKNRR